MAGLTNDQKRRLAAALIQAAGDLLAGGAEVPATIPADIPRQLAEQQLARWLCRLPGDSWDPELAEVPGEPRTRQRSR